MAMTMQARGRLGGLATLAKHGREHMSKIGKAGFRRLCCRFQSNSRRQALRFLQNKGLVVAHCPAKLVGQPGWQERDEAAYAALCAELGIE